MMIYSRLLYTEYEHPVNEDNEGGYTVFSTQQSLDINYMPLDVVCMQKFGVIWERKPDTRVIDLIEQAIIMGQLSPVKVLHASKGTLFIAYDAQLNAEKFEGFEEAWEDIASCVMYDPWTTVFIKDRNVGQGFYGGRLFRAYVPEILATNELSITGYTADMFCFGMNGDLKILITGQSLGKGGYYQMIQIVLMMTLSFEARERLCFFACPL